MFKQITKAIPLQDFTRDFQANVKHFNAWVDARIEERLVMFVQWVFSKRAVQRAIAESITCSTPIGRMLNEHIEDRMDSNDRNEVDADNVRGLERYIESAIEDFVRDSLEDEIANHIDYEKVAEAVIESPDFQEEVTKASVEASIKEFIERLKT